MTQTARASRLVAAIPNTLSISRIGLAAFFPMVAPSWRLAVVVAGALTDCFDGLIARRFDLVTVRGGLLDAIADKLFVTSVLATLTFDGRVTWWAALVVMARDFTVAGVAAYAAIRGEWPAFKRMGVRPLGRATTVAQFVLFVSLLLAERAADPWVLGVTAGLSLLAAGDYLVRLLRAVQESP